MDDQEIGKLFEDLSQMMAQSRMDWVTAQVKEQIQLGKVQDEEVKVLRHQRASEQNDRL